MKFRMKKAHALLSLGLGLVAAAGIAYAADHLDGPAAKSDKATDITDIYAWMQDADKINLILNVHPLADATSKFSDAAEYVLHVNSSASYGAAQTETQIVCTFSTDQKVTCTVGDNTVIDAKDASAEAGVSSTDGKFKIFTGLRADPFYFDLENFNAARAAVVAAASSLTFDAAGCPDLSSTMDLQNTRTALVNTVTAQAGGVTGSHTGGTDFFGALNVLSIVIQADRTLFGNGPVYSVWASTRK